MTPVPSAVRKQFLAAEVIRLQDENRRLHDRIRLLASAFSQLAGGEPLDVQLPLQEEHA